ncbi:MAG: gamma carbonic anhydrase family protein [Candidatus Helarchaeota archaeon]
MILPNPKGIVPKIHEKAFIAPNATIIGDVEIGKGTNVWFGAVIRGDFGPIRIGKNTSIQDNVTIHCEPGKEPLIIGDYVIVGHNAMVHGPSRIGNNITVGINATVLPYTEIGDGSVIGANAVLTERTKVEPGTLAVGNVSAQPRKKYTDAQIQRIIAGAQLYVQNGRKFKKMLEEKKI